ncbi:type IV pilin N-terminal domain-containing protein [Halobaculum limi]|uniref:type IV pilin N-terminal domain-containing protein n=1 Tax=Halobaculum limi TaxID=3031916 RepID=UPI0032E5251F
MDEHRSDEDSPDSRASDTSPRADGRDRAVTPTVGVVLLVAVTIALAATVGAAALATGTPASPPPTAVVDLSVRETTLTLTHRAGSPLDVRDLRIVVRVDGDRLRYQPPVPFFAARGFHGGPTGPFNSASDPTWSAGETASLSVAGTNRPRLRVGSVVRVTLYEGEFRLVVVRAVVR